MFNDLDSVYRLDLNNVKASPSVNSPNDGRFNSEENARWANKKLVTKPFIYGVTEEDVAKSFGSEVSLGWYGAYNSDAMVSIDGYLLRFADSQNISYDSPNEKPGPDINLMPAQSFISGLVNAETQYELPTGYSDFLFSDYNPAGKTIDDEFKAMWNEAVLQDGIVGFIRNVYMDSYLDALTVSGNIVYYNNTQIPCTLQTDPSPDDLSAYTAPVARKYVQDETVTRVDIYYPVRVKKFRQYNLTSKQYEDSVRIYFNDIFGVNFVFSSERSNTHGYPYTFNNFMDMDNNAPVDQLGSVDCDASTMPTRLYNFMQLYDTFQTPLERQGFTETVTDYINTFPSGLMGTVFTKYTQSQLITNFIPSSVSPDVIPSIKNTLSYYCLNLGNLSNVCLTISDPNNPGNLIAVPVSFMTSNGAVTPEGFITGSGISKNYPVEGYLHFIKRLYVISTGNLSPTEEQIQAVSLQQLVSWTDLRSIPANGTTEGVTTVSLSFTYFYQTFLYPCICMLLNLEYNSLIDNVVFSEASYKMKACGAGNAVLGKSHTTESGVVVNQDYTFTGYDNVSNTLTPNDWTQTVEYHKDVISDYDRIHENTLKITGSNFVGGYYYKEPFNWSAPYVPNYFEDPINLIKRCLTTDTTNSIPTASGSTVFYIIGGANLDTLVSQQILGVSVRLCLDDLLFPCIPKQNAYDKELSKAIDPASFVGALSSTVKIMFNGTGTSDSFANGAHLNFAINCWDARLPYVLQLRKDSQNYLSGKSYIDGKYNGAEFKFLFNLDEITQDQLLLFEYVASATPRVLTYDYESFNSSINYMDSKVKTLREAYIHISKIYGDDYTPLKEIIQGMIDISIAAVEQDIQNIQTQISGPGGLDSRISTVENNINNPSTGLRATVDTCVKLLHSGLIDNVSAGVIYYYVYGLGPNDTNKVCEIKGYGNILDYDSPFDEQINNPNLSPFVTGEISGIKTVIVHPGIASIGSYTFSFEFDTLYLPYTINYLNTHLCSGTVDSLSGPKFVHLENGIRWLKDDCFQYSRVENVLLPSSLMADLNYGNYWVYGVGYKAFNGCSNLKTITFDTYNIGTSVCQDCINLDFIQITTNVHKICAYAFDGCTEYGIHIPVINYLGNKTQFDSVSKETGWNSLNAGDTWKIQRINCSEGHYDYNSVTNTYDWTTWTV